MKHSYLTALVLITVIAIIAVGSQLIGIRLYDRIATNLLISLVLVVGLQTFMGNSGLLSFAHIGFMGLGAYTSAVLTIPAQMKGMALPDLYEFMKAVEVSPLLAMFAAGLVAAVVHRARAHQPPARDPGRTGPVLRRRPPLVLPAEGPAGLQQPLHRPDAPAEAEALNHEDTKGTKR